MAGPEPVPLLQLTDSVVAALATNGVVLDNFGECFAGFDRGAAPCGSCGRGRRLAAADYNRARECILGLAVERKRLLKRLLRADQVRLTVVRPGKRITVTF